MVALPPPSPSCFSLHPYARRLGYAWRKSRHHLPDELRELHGRLLRLLGNMMAPSHSSPSANLKKASPEVMQLTALLAALASPSRSRHVGLQASVSTIDAATQTSHSGVDVYQMNTPSSTADGTQISYSSTTRGLKKLMELVRKFHRLYKLLLPGRPRS